ncbi:MAG: magnesium transporter [Bacilli bacterium]|nr:magnesium transporter [Bacilli bacterium]
MNKKNIQIEIIEIIRDLQNDELLESLKAYHPYDLALSLALLEKNEREKVYTLLNEEQLAEIFSYLDDDDSKDIIEEDDSSIIAAIINEMEPDDAYNIISNLDDEEAKAIVELLDDEIKDDLEILLGYEDDTAGSLMNTNFIQIESGKDIKELMRLLVEIAPDVESINTSFVINPAGELLGTIDLKKLIIAKSPKLVDAIMDTNFTYVNTNDDIEEVTKKISNYDIYDMPVLENGIIKGIITIDDALMNISEEAEEDYAKLAGLADTDKIDEPISKSIKKRLPILALLLVLDIFVAIIISAYDYLFTIPALTVITIFQPVVLGLAGNSGVQSLGITIRKISLSKLERASEITKHVIAEFAIGLLSSFVIGILVFVFSSGYLYLTGQREIYLEIGLVVTLSVVIGLVISNLFGSIIPIFLYKIKLDPASISGPFITTCIDILVVVIYFSLTATLIYQNIT